MPAERSRNSKQNRPEQERTHHDSQRDPQPEQPVFDPQDASLLDWQRAIGNQGIQRALAQGALKTRRSGDLIQAKLTVGAPDDVYEQEADDVAQSVMRMPDAAVQRQALPEEEELQMKRIQRAEVPEEEELQMKRIQRAEVPEEEELQMKRIQRAEVPEEEELQMKRIQRAEVPEEEELQMKRIQRDAVGGVPEMTDDIEGSIEGQRGGGQGLPDSARDFFEPRFGQDFSGVQIHTGKEADTLNRQLDARAFTTGSDIFFRDGEYNPQSSSGRELLAHELTHVVQQGASAAIQMKPDGTIQRQDTGDAASATTTTPAVAAPAPDTSVEGALTSAALQEIRGQALARTLKLGMYATRGMQVVDRARTKLVAFSERYNSVYDVYAGIVGEARSEARNQQDWIDFFAGVAIGVGVGLLAEAIVVGAIGEAAAASLSLAQRALIGTVAEAAEGGVSAAGHGLGVIPTVAGQDLEPGGIRPDFLNSNIWHSLSDLYRGIAQVQQMGWALPLLTSNIEYAIAEQRRHEEGSANQEMPRADLTSFTLDLVAWNRRMSSVDAAIDRALPVFDQIDQGINSAPDYPRDRLEQDIWIIWMASLPDDQSDVLDLDAIEDHLHSIHVLGENSRLGVDFGWYTSEDDEREALAAARNEVGPIREHFGTIMGAGTR
jgi:hypothetical protein